MKTIILALASRILAAALSVVTPFLRDMVESKVQDWWREAKQTENPNDDLFIKRLAELLKIELPE